MSTSPSLLIALVMLCAALVQLCAGYLAWRRFAGSGTAARLGAAIAAFLIPSFLPRVLLGRLVGRRLRAIVGRMRRRARRADAHAVAAPAQVVAAEDGMEPSRLLSPELSVRFGASVAGNHKLNIPKVVE